jgi:hypothetical protein
LNKSVAKMKFDVCPMITVDSNGATNGAATMYMDHNDMRLSVRATEETFNGSDMKG